MRQHRITRTFTKISVFILGGICIWICDGCKDKVTPPPVPAPNFYLDVFFLNGNPEIFVDETNRLGGYLSNSSGDTLSGEKIYFSVEPSSAGNIGGAVGGAQTDPDDPSGFNRNVTFVGRNPMSAVISARYRNAEGLTLAIDTLAILVKRFGNE